MFIEVPKFHNPPHPHPPALKNFWLCAWLECYTSMNIRKFLKRETTSSDDSVSSKSTEKISEGKDEENVNVSTNCKTKKSKKMEWK